jgi:hypothetical protein
MGGLSDFERGQMFGVHLAEAYMTKAATLLGTLRVTASKVMSAYTNHGETTSTRGTLGKNKH